MYDCIRWVEIDWHYSNPLVLREIFVLARIHVCIRSASKKTNVFDKALVKAERVLILWSGDMNQMHLPVPGFTTRDTVYEGTQNTWT
jgi:hypothetical protein